MLSALAGVAQAQAIPSWHDEYTKRLKYEEVTSPLKDDLFGDNISLYDGTVKAQGPQRCGPCRLMQGVVVNCRRFAPSAWRRA